MSIPYNFLKFNSMKRIFHVLAMLLVPALFHQAKANDIVVSIATLTGQDVTAGANNAANFTFIQFDLNWSNSWRTSTGPLNWDAAWIFVKYQINGGTGCTPSNVWNHATLSPVSGNHSVLVDNGVPASASAAADGTGVFLYRAGDGSGNINWDQVRLRWNYGADGILDACNVTIKVYAIEMVYVPQGNYYLGDGASNGGQFEAGISGVPFQVTGEGSIVLGGGGAGSIGNNNRTGQTAPTDDFADGISVALPAAFPKGWEDFYTMKYEITQEQYVEFLNVLTANQQLARHGATVVNRFFTNGGGPVARNGVKCTTLPVGATPGVYACDLNNNGVVNQSGDGQNIAIPGLTTMDLLGYLDWSGLRPMTELELEKVGRGNLPAVINEYAWGSASIYATSYAPLINGGAGNELPTTPSTTLGNAAYQTTANVGGIGGPLRAGVFATATSTRVAAGASYYGVMEITGNVWELVVSVGGLAGRSFTGVHGDGEITSTGNADVDFWPGSNGNGNVAAANTTPNTGSTHYAGMMFKSGSWQDVPFLRLSDRLYSGWTGLNTRDPRNGGRGARTAP
jgi:formylglycine-generating enzyme required for sulfatase activity